MDDVAVGRDIETVEPESPKLSVADQRALDLIGSRKRIDATSAETALRGDGKRALKSLEAVLEARLRSFTDADYARSRIKGLPVHEAIRMIPPPDFDDATGKMTPYSLKEWETAVAELGRREGVPDSTGIGSANPFAGDVVLARDDAAAHEASHAATGLPSLETVRALLANPDMSVAAIEDVAEDPEDAFRTRRVAHGSGRTELRNLAHLLKAVTNRDGIGNRKDALDAIMSQPAEALPDDVQDLKLILEKENAPAYLDNPLFWKTAKHSTESSGLTHMAAAKAGDADRFAQSRNFLATDETPDTLFGIPIVADRSQYTPEDLAFFRKHPEAGGYYDMGDEEGAPGEPPMQAASEAGDTWTWETYRWNPEAKGGRKIDPKNIKGTGVSFDAAKERLRVPKGREAEFEGWMDSLANLPSTIKANGRSVPIKSFLVPKDWRTNTEYDRDYDYVAAFLADAKPGPLDHGPKEGWFWHMGDAGKMPTHPTFSRESYYARDPRYSDLAGNWEGETYIPGKAERAVRQDNNGGKAKKKIPPIVKGPIHYGSPPPPSRGKYPGIANNPGNVEKHERRSDKTLFKGEIEGGVRPKRFANFSDPVDGLVAAAAVLSRRAAGLAAKGLPFTIENYVPGYAPKSENDTEGYIRNLSRYSGFARDAALDTGNADDMAKLLKNVVRFESGTPNSEWFTDDEYRRAALAMQEGASDR